MPVSESHEAPKGNEAKVVANWNDIMAGISASGKFRIFTALFGIKPQFNEGKLILCVADNDKKRLLTENIDFIKESIKSAVGVETEITITSDMPVSSSNTSGEDVFSNLGNIGKNFPGNIRID